MYFSFIEKRKLTSCERILASPSNSKPAMSGENDVTSNQNQSIDEENYQTLTEINQELGILPSSPAFLVSLMIRCCLFMKKYPEKTKTLLRRLLFCAILFMYLIVITFSFYSGTNVFPSLFPFCTWVFALYGVLKDNDQLFIPFMLSIGCDLIHGLICFLFMVSFHMYDRHALLNKFLYDYWPGKAEKFDKFNRDDFVLYVLIYFTFIFIGFACCFFYFINYKMQKKIDEVVTPELGQSDQEASQNPAALIFSELPPPPSYETFSHSILPPPQSGTPPPPYCMTEREERPTPIFEEQNNAQERIESNETSSSNNKKED